jgi:hypothetical protein
MNHPLPLLAILLLPPVHSIFSSEAAHRPVILHVDAGHGDDSGAGNAEAPFRTLMKAAETVAPGDTVLVHPGVYFEHVKLERGGTEDAPVTFRSVSGPDRTIITGANRKLRLKQLDWQAVEGSPGLFRVPLSEEPATVLCDDLNLYRYPSVDELRTFTVNDVALQKMPGPGPKHGFAWRDGFLYVRLHPSGKDGDPDPNSHTMKASPARGSGFRGDEIDARQRANFSTFTPGPAHVVIEGFTFESPGFCGVWVRHGQVTVRGCRFLGCRTGVRGWDRPEKKPRSLSEDVIVERCEFTEHPMYADVLEIIQETAALPETSRRELARFFWWHRKGGPFSSELGLVTAAGRRWKIRDNSIHDTLDGLSFMSLSWSEDCEVTGNCFERIVDNAVEAENHAQRLLVRENTVVDCFEPFSYQPLDGEPWPAQIVFERNTVSFTSVGASLWGNPLLGWRPGCVKIFVPGGVEVVPGGLIVRDNLLWFPTGSLISVNQAATGLRGVRFEGNVIAARALGGHEDGAPARHIEFVRNQATIVPPGDADASFQTLSSEAMTLHDSSASLGIEKVDEGSGAPTIRAQSAASRAGSPFTP